VWSPRCGRRSLVAAGIEIRRKRRSGNTFHVTFNPRVAAAERVSLLGVSLFVDLEYFEKRAGRRV
jgi:hypothetical protein